MAQRHQRGWLKKEPRTQGETWMLFFRITRKCDAKRVESKIPIGLVKNFPQKSDAWAEVERLHLQINEVNSRRGIKFGDLAQHYAELELVDHTESIHAKAHTTVLSYERILRNRLLPRWGDRIALGIEPLEVEQWLKDLKRKKRFANPTLEQDAPSHVADLQAWPTIWTDSSKPRIEPDALRSLRTLLASGTGLRISECLGLQWQDVSFADATIHVRRTRTCGQVGLPKSKASKGPVPLHPLLAEFMLRWKQKTPYSKSCDWVFRSSRLEGKQPRFANMLVEDHLRPAAVKAGILSSHRDVRGRLIDHDPRRFGFHNLRHSLASFLIRIRTDPKTVQTLLRHSDVKLTLQFYTHAVSRDRMAAAGKMLTAILSHAARQSGLKGDWERIALT